MISPIRPLCTPEDFQMLFSDIICEVRAETPEITDAMIEGFRLALKDWTQYHAGQIKELTRAELLLTEAFQGE